MSKVFIRRFLLLSLTFAEGIFRLAAPAFAAEKLVGLQSAPSVAMALPWFAEEARLYSKHDLDFQLVYIASSGIVTAAMSSGNGNVGIVGGEGPMAESLKMMVSDRELAYKVISRKIGLSDRKVFDAAYTQELKVLEPRFEIKPIAIQATLDEIAKTDPRAKQVKAEQLIDRRFLEEMEKDGTFERLGLK